MAEEYKNENGSDVDDEEGGWDEEEEEEGEEEELAQEEKEEGVEARLEALFEEPGVGGDQEARMKSIETSQLRTETHIMAILNHLRVLSEKSATVGTEIRVRNAKDLYHTTYFCDGTKDKGPKLSDVLLLAMSKNPFACPKYLLKFITKHLIQTCKIKKPKDEVCNVCILRISCFFHEYVSLRVLLSLFTYFVYAFNEYVFLSRIRVSTYFVFLSRIRVSSCTSLFTYFVYRFTYTCYIHVLFCFRSNNGSR